MIKVKVKVKSEDKGLEALRKRLASAKGRVRLGVGMHSSEFAMDHPGHAGRTFGFIGVSNEFGDPGRNIPARPFIGGWFDEKLPQFRISLVEMMRGLVEGRVASLALAFKAIGPSYAQDLRTYAGDPSHFVPNALKTIRKKGFDHPLKETGELITPHVLKDAVYTS